MTLHRPEPDVREARRPTAADRRRQVAVTISEVLCVLGTLVGVGALGGTRVEESSGGALAADATLLAPAGPAFSIWSAIYLGLAAYTVWQWLPDQATDPRHRRIGWLAAASMLLNAAWLLVTQQGWIWVSVLVIAALAVVLGVLVRRLTERPSYGLAEAVIVDGTFGAYLGWVCVATCANVTAALVSSGVDGEAGERARGGGGARPRRRRGRPARPSARGPVRRGPRHRVGPGVDRGGPRHRRAAVVADRLGRDRRRCRGGRRRGPGQAPEHRIPRPGPSVGRGQEVARAWGARRPWSGRRAGTGGRVR